MHSIATALQRLSGAALALAFAAAGALAQPAASADPAASAPSPGTLPRVASSASAPVAPAVDRLDALVREAFLWGYPYHEFMALRHTAMHDAQSLTYTTPGRFRHQRHLAGPTDRWANGPIRDTLYSTAWLDLAAGPVMLSLPDTADRYYVVVLIGADTNSFHYLGRRSTGTRARQVALLGPGWDGPLPAGADQVVRSPTRDLYLNMRVLVRDEADLAAAHQVQDGFRLVLPSSESVGSGGPAEPPRQRPQDGDVGRLVDVINEALARNPPPADQKALLERYREVGLCGAACRFADLPAALQARWRAQVPALIARLKTALDASRRDVRRVNGWNPYRLPRDFGTQWAMRAGSAANSGGIFGLEAAEATYFMAVADADGEPLGQGRRYRLRLPNGGLPADAFWSITLYEFVEGGQYMVDNPIGRYAIGDRTPGLVRGADGSLELWIQPEAPADAAGRANWLPSPPQRRFYMNARLYQPLPEVLDPAWALPAVRRVAD